MDLKNTLTPEQFIIEGKQFEVIVKFDDVNISIISYVVMEDEIYYLYIKGNYPRGSSVKISLSRPDLNLSINDMWKLSQECLTSYVPYFPTKDYPDSLKKVAEDNAKKQLVK